jgi:Ribbon-helix-helix protein, copG family
MSTADFEAMSTPEDFERYFASTSDHSEFVQWMQRTGRAAPPDEITVDVPEGRMEITAVRLPQTTIERLDQLAGNDKAGRSGLIRLAIAELLAKIDREAA